MSDNGKRRKWLAADKLRIVLAGMQPNVEVSDLCRREGISPTQYYGWKKQLLSSATKVFDAQEGKRSAVEEKKEAELQRYKNVIAEITAENLELKKTL
jgi:transposase